MGSPIDPVTGLPMVGVPDVISQIPLGKQVVPFEDLDAISRPQQGPAYPNDILNTLAYVTGENTSSPGSMHAATMTPDRRLRVDSASSSGTVGPAVCAFSFLQFTTANAGDDTHLISFFSPLPEFLYSIVIAATLDSSSPTVDDASQTRLWLQETGTSNILPIGAGWIRKASLDPTWEPVLSFDPPIALRDTFANTSNNVDLFLASNSYDVDVIFSYRASSV